MQAIRATYDGKEIHIPKGAQGFPPCNVIVLFEEDKPADDSAWLKMQEHSLAKAWDDKEDSVYDGL
jgi:hypothetical protein